MSDPLDKIVSNLTQPIPAPYKPPPKPRKSWRDLPAGGWVTLRVPWYTPETGRLDIGTRLVVESADTEGVWLRVLHGALWVGDNLDMKVGGRMRFTKPQWEATLEKVKKPPKPRKRKEPPHAESTT